MNPVAEVVGQRKAVAFDLFHTLTSAESVVGQGLPTTCEVLGVTSEAWQEQLFEHSRSRLVGEAVDPFRIIGSMARAIDPAIADETIREATVNRIKRFGAALLGIPLEHKNVLQRLKQSGKKLGLISNADVMEVAEWDKSPIASLFDATVISCRVGAAKPDREIFEICLRQLGVSADEALFVGDGGSSELAGAHAVGLTTVMMTGVIKELWPERIGQHKADADYIVEQLSELLDSSGDTQGESVAR